LEIEQKELSKLLASGELYAKERQRVPALQARLQSIEAELLQALERWELLASR
jgi:ATP-binding cassette subfamily F protein uup